MVVTKCQLCVELLLFIQYLEILHYHFLIIAKITDLDTF